MPRAGKRDKFEEEWADEMRRDFGTTEPLREKIEDLRHTEKWLPPLLLQLDEAAVFLVRDAWPRLTAWLRRSFPRAAEALPTAKWAQIGWVALGLFAADWLVMLGPRTGHNMVQFIGLGMVGYTGWQIWRRMQLVRRDELAQRFVQLTSQLGNENMEQRIGALGALDQLAFDNPRYRLPLVHLLGAWLDARPATELGNHDSAVVRQMIQEFEAMLAAEPPPAEPVAPEPRPAEASAATEPIVVVAPVAAAAEPAADVEAQDVAGNTAEPADAPPALEVLAVAPVGAEPAAPPPAAVLASQEHTEPHDTGASSGPRVTTGE